MKKQTKNTQESYKWACSFGDNNETILFNNRNYNVALTTGLNSSGLCPLSCVFDSGNGPSLVPEEMVKPDRMKSIRVYEKQRLQSATTEMVEDVGTIMLHVGTGEARVQETFGIVRNSTLSILLGAFSSTCLWSDSSPPIIRWSRTICSRYQCILFTRR